jgi:DNA polymerase I-like protein with 3'-5' exonuclease and polymerase domains
MWYSLRHEKDRFSTLNQGTGSYCFDVWLGFVLKERPQLTGQFHDEGIWEINPEEKEKMEELLKNSINEANQYLNLNIDLDIGIQFGNNYGEIH